MPRLKLRRKTAADWATANPVLAEGEPGYEKDTKNLKIGDGVTSWNLLPYANDQRIATANPTGIVTTFAGSTAPSGWLMCDGTAISRDTYSALFTAIGTTYGVGDGSTTFNLPDLRSKVPVGKAASGTFSTLGGFTGSETVSLAIGNLPAHSHSIDHGHTANSHTHTNDHNHGTVTSGAGSAHGHTGTTSSNGLHNHREQLIGESSRSLSGTGTENLEKEPGMGGLYMTTHDGTHNHTFTTSNESAHTHPVDLPNYTGNTGGTTPTINNHTGNSGSIGSGTPASIVQPSLVMNYIIKT